MSGIFKTIGIEEAKALIGGFEYALLYNIEGIELIKLDSIDYAEGEVSSADYESLLKECYEAHFFDSGRELRLCRDDIEGVLADWKKAVMISDPSEEEGMKSDANCECDCKGEFRGSFKPDTIIWQDKKYELAGRYKSSGKAVIVRQYLMPDVDGQMCVKATRLVGIEV